MKKSRLQIIILASAVVAVWGIIGWKIFSPLPEMQHPAKNYETPLPTLKPPADSLWLNYRNPFEVLGNKKPLEQQKQYSFEQIPSVDPRIYQSNINYYGSISVKEKQSFLFEIEGVNCVLALEEEYNGFRLSGDYRDSLTFQKNGVSFTILKIE